MTSKTEINITRPPFRDIKPPKFKTERERDAWRESQDRAERERERAWRECPPGSVLHVTTARGIKTRRRAGLQFARDQRARVEVLAEESKVAELVAAGRYAVTPEGALAIIEDDGLTCYTGPASSAPPNALGVLEAENAELRARLAELERKTKSAARRANNPAAPQRLGKGQSGAAGEGEGEGAGEGASDTEAGDFGGEAGKE